MPLTPPSGFSDTAKTPGFVVGILFGAGPVTASEAPMVLCVMGNKRSGGTAVLDTPVMVSGPDASDTLFDPHSELTRMLRRVFSQFRAANVWATPVTDSGGVAATSTLAFAAAATASGSFNLTIVNETIQVAVNSGDTAATVGSNVAAAINAQTHWPCTAAAITAATTIAVGSSGVSLPQATINVASTTGFPTAGTATVVTGAGTQTVAYTGITGTTLTGCTGGTGSMTTGGAVTSVGALTITWSNVGTRGNNGRIRFAFSATLATMCSLNGYVASTASGTGLFGDTTNAATSGIPVAGTLTDSMANALANMAAMKFDRIAAAQVDTSNWTLLRNQLNTYAGIAQRKRQQGIVCCVKTLASALTDAATQNALRLQIAWHKNSDLPAGEVAAQVATARIWGDNQVGGGIGTSKGEQTYRGCNLDGTLLADVPQQYLIADQPLGTDIESALNNGLTPLAPAAANPGFAKIVRSITNRFQDAQGNANYAVLDTTKVTVIDYVADTIEAFMPTTYPNKNLAPDQANGRPYRHPDIVTPSQVKGALVGELFTLQDAGLTTTVAQHLNEIVCEIDVNNGGLLLGYIPFDVINGFHGAAITLAQTG